MNLQCKQKKNKIKIFIANTAGNSIPLVMLVALVVMIIGGAVAYGTVQVFSAVKGETHSQLTYFAAEAALERSMCSLDSKITKVDYAALKGISYSGNKEDFINKIVDSINNDSSVGLGTQEVDVYPNNLIGKASVSIKYSWIGGSNYRLEGLKKIIIPITITATAQMENGIFKSYGKKAVATREYAISLPGHFQLNGAVYTLGDLLATTEGTDYNESSINGDVYVFGTGLAETKRMEQYYNGGICADKNAVLKIYGGNAYTNSLVRAGDFFESENSTESCAVVVEKDIVAQGIQVFGHNDSIVVLRDAYTFDDVELSGADSYIAINKNYYGLSSGDGSYHDTSSAIVNVAPVYHHAYKEGYFESRIVIGGNVFVNGSTFRIEVPAEGTAGHKMEDASLAWINKKPAYVHLGTEPTETTDNYITSLESIKGVINGFSILLQTIWDNDDAINMSNWKNWINEINSKANNYTNDLSNTPPGQINKIKGFCNYALAANNRIYFMNVNFNDSEIVKPGEFTCNIEGDIENLRGNFFEEYYNNATHNWNSWTNYTNIHYGMPAALEELKGILENHVQVFATKEYNGDEIDYSFTTGVIPGYGGGTQFMVLSDYLENKTNDPSYNCILRYNDEAGDVVTVVDVIDDLKATYSEPEINNEYFLILNLDPEKELHIDKEINGIIFSHGKVVIEKDGKVNGAVIAAGRGYDPTDKVKGSAADNDDNDNPRLPKVVINENVDSFKNWEYVALVFENGGSIVFPGRNELLTAIKTSTGIDLINVF